MDYGLTALLDKSLRRNGVQLTSSELSAVSKELIAFVSELVAPKPPEAVTETTTVVPELKPIPPTGETA